MRTRLEAGKNHMRSNLRGVRARGRRLRNRLCITCEAEYVAVLRVYPDPRCPRCAALLADGGDRYAELGAGD